ncbi:bifunctional phosphopantothenoylcysteine decarboxylase/phosphopantothenate--cysteine ligase CoaBC [Demequina sp. B12]|uniref:bifunctional phosphopantothenoylcysteine decarboxylase/phosphopantothenate--cysteine ligase CoaBC n=1 Tax=Demequina sp. B12 TaxID=2992757 RepID=UPI00237B2095|nr:bifunctional phosphopantothenoylcysteine decarboxylase/phosphopantothenate--cysteine ligase CoaBC [Demequina sp. B12]MDE0573063.1 bifunctional phosphopantothenoylcysteine decarboxylase/phosphopantothenate--cysteine ligase CoaBC [Demequina sp. B12]
MRVLLGVTGGIAAYKSALVLRLLKEDGHDVRVVPTAASLNFVGRATWEALSGHPAPTETFENVPSVQHVRLGQRADAVLVAPATADFLAQMAAGRATDLLGNALLATEAPVLVCPAMHTEMWNDPAVVANVATLRERGVHVLEPAVGRLTGPDSGPGRLPDPEVIVAALYEMSGHGGASSPAEANHGTWGDLDGVRVLVTAGGTREPIDPVRYIGNRSSGLQGFAVAEAARERGAQVTVIAANVTLPLGEGIERVDVETAAQMQSALASRAERADVVVMAAAVADYRLAAVSESKLKKTGDSGLTLELEQTPDLLQILVRLKSESQVVVGFAAETGDATGSVLDHGAHKARRKGADLLVVNEVGVSSTGQKRGFGTPDNSVTVLNSQGAVVAEGAGSKVAVAHLILDSVSALRA